MKTDSEFHTFEDRVEKVRITFNGEDILVRDGGNLAAELLLVGIKPFRHTATSGAPRNPFCMMGACFDCLVEIDGKAVQSCMLIAQEGLVVRSVTTTKCCNRSKSTPDHIGDEEEGRSSA